METRLNVVTMTHRSHSRVLIHIQARQTWVETQINASQTDDVIQDQALQTGVVTQVQATHSQRKMMIQLSHARLRSSSQRSQRRSVTVRHRLQRCSHSVCQFRSDGATRCAIVHSGVAGWPPTRRIAVSGGRTDPGGRYGAWSAPARHAPTTEEIPLHSDCRKSPATPT